MYVPEIVAVVSKGDEIICNMPFDMIILVIKLLHGTRIDFVTKQFGIVARTCSPECSWCVWL